VLRAVLDAGFFVTAAYPVHSELPLSVHIGRSQAISYDAILVCRKRLPSAPSAWATVEGKIRRASKALGGMGGNGHRVSAWNHYVVVMGKCLECYSVHFPEVFDKDGSAVSVEEAIARMKRVADVMLGGRVPGGGANAGPGALWAGRVGRAGGGPWQ
jgi:adenine-specific DNA methylase